MGKIGRIYPSAGSWTVHSSPAPLCGSAALPETEAPGLRGDIAIALFAFFSVLAVIGWALTR